MMLSTSHLPGMLLLLRLPPPPPPLLLAWLTGFSGIA
jgi:hypothetical protein